jgi:hypothetical protein
VDMKGGRDCCWSFNTIAALEGMFSIAFKGLLCRMPTLLSFALLSEPPSNAASLAPRLAGLRVSSIEGSLVFV